VVSRGLFPAYRGKRNVETVEVEQFDRVTAKIRQVDAVIVGGGGILQEYSGWSPQNEVGKLARGMNYYGQVVNLAYKLGKPLYFYGIGIGPFFTSQGKQYAIDLLCKAQAITVRDEKSDQFLEKHLSGTRYRMTDDPALNLESIPAQQSKLLLQREGVPNGKPLVGICLRPWFFQTNEKEQLMRRIAKAANTIVQQEGAHLLLLPFSRYRGDQLMMKELTGRLNANTYTLLEKAYEPKMMKGICGQLSLMIGMRLHSLILAASMGVPVIGLTYDDKVTQFVKRIQDDNAIISYNHLRPQLIVDISEKLLHVSPSWKKSFQSRINQLKHEESQNSQFLFR
jgi:polysaccharide pyruvyl transferase CsaB